MALINCPECTHTISDQSASCTNCGCPTSKMRFLMRCPACSGLTDNQSSSCTNCRFPIVKPALSQDTPPSYKKLIRLKELEINKALEELEELEEEEYGFFTNTNMFIITCIILYFIAKDEIHLILRHVIGLF